MSRRELVALLDALGHGVQAERAGELDDLAHECEFASGAPSGSTNVLPAARMRAVRWWDSRAVKGDGL